MTQKTKVSDMQREVIEKITRGDVSMRPGVYFTVALVSGVIAAIASIVLMAYFVRVVAIAIRIGTATTPAYGAKQNLANMLGLFPWWTLLLATVSGLVAAWLLNKYGRLYRYEARSIIGLFLILTIALGFAFSFVGEPRGFKQNAVRDTSQQRGSTTHPNAK